MAHVWNIIDGDIYVSKNGDDLAGDGSMANPYASINKATDVGADGNKIVIGTGIWQEARGISTNLYLFTGDGTVVFNLLGGFRLLGDDEMHGLIVIGQSTPLYTMTTSHNFTLENCVFNKVYFDIGGSSTPVTFNLYKCVFDECVFEQYYQGHMYFYADSCMWKRCSCLSSTGVLDLRLMHMEKLINSIMYENIHFGGSQTGVDYICMYNCNWATSGSSQVTLEQIQTGGFMPNSIGLNPRFNNVDIEDYTLKSDSPCLYSGKNNATIGAFGLGYSFNANSSEFTEEGGAVFSQTTSVNDIIRTSQTINGITRFLFQLAAGHLSGNIESAWIDLQSIRYLLITRIFANLIYNASGTAISLPDNLETAGEKAIYYDFELMYCNEESEKDTAAFKNVIWNKAVTIDNSDRGNANPDFVASEAKYISARFIKIKLYMTEA